MGKHYKKETKNGIIRKSILTLFIMLSITSSVEIIKWYYNNKQNQKIQKEISKVIIINDKQNKDSKYNIDFQKLKEKNQDSVGWLKVEGTKIEYVVVKSKDNNYYLNHNFEKKYNNAGWIFADYKNELDGTDKNIVIYGHNRRDGSMFGTLKDVLKKDWYSKEENSKITFITEKEEAIYKVFSVYQIKAEDYYMTTEFNNLEFLKYIETIKHRSINDFNIDVTQKDSLLTLSTCANDNKYRVVLHAKKIK